MESKGQWSDLPEELLAVIGKCLNTRIVVLRLRAVCTSWRSFIPPFSPSPLTFPLPIPPNCPTDEIPSGNFTVKESTLYCLESSQQNPNPWSLASSKSSKGGILAQVQEEEISCNIRLLTPLHTRQIKHWQRTCPKGLNLLDFPLSTIRKTYHTRRYVFNNNDEPRNYTVSKLALLSSNPMNDSYAAMAIYHHGLYGPGRLCFIKSGDKEWTNIDDQLTPYEDVITYKGRFYAVTKSGSAIVIDSISKVSEIASPVGDGRSTEKQLVELLGDLLLVDGNPCLTETEEVPFKVFKLNEQEGKWVEMKSLGDRALFVCNDCSFSVSARDFIGCKENCIYFTHRSETDTSVFNLKDGSNRLLHLSWGISLRHSFG